MDRKNHVRVTRVKLARELRTKGVRVKLRYAAQLDAVHAL